MVETTDNLQPKRFPVSNDCYLLLLGGGYTDTSYSFISDTLLYSLQKKSETNFYISGTTLVSYYTVIPIS